MNEFLTWQMLATYAGATIFTGIVTQFIKGASFLQKVPTRLMSYIIAAVALIAGTAFTAGLTIESGALCLVNAFVVSLASNGGYELLKKGE